MPEALVSPLDDAWRDAIDTVLRAHGWPALSDAARLGPLVARLSEAYNQEGVAGAGGGSLAARLAFSFARDVPKGAGAVRELVQTGRLALPEGRPLRVLDLGAGLGATTWGVARALAAASPRSGAIDATWVDADAAALGVASELVRARGDVSSRARVGAPHLVSVRARTIVGGAVAPRGEPWDLVLLGQVLSELDGALPGPARVEKHAALVCSLLDGAVRPDGALVVVEPALRDRTRHLHAVRDAVLAASGPDAVQGGARERVPGTVVFAPCLHGGPCPARATEGDWCHEDLAVDLPEWLVPIARAAGLRWQGLTFSYLVLRRDGASLEDRGFPWRVVSGPLVTKGKRELFMCGAEAGAPARLRVQRLDRHASASNEAWDALSRGARIRVRPQLARPEYGGVAKVGPDASVDVDAPTE
jgi:hypothetical protein